MAKRITSERTKKWAIGAGLVGVPLAVLLIWFLVSMGSIEVTGYSGDVLCAGTEFDPCVAYINISVKEDIFIYPSEDWSSTPFYTDVQPKSVRMYRSWGKYWREINLSKPCNGAWCGCYWCSKSNTAKFSYVFRNNSDYQLKYEILKENFGDDIKWGFGPVDPVFLGYNSDNLEKTYDSKINEVTISDKLSGEDQLKMRLITEQNNLVIRGANRTIAKLFIENYVGEYSIENFVDKIDTYNILDGMNLIDRDFSFKIEETYQVIVPKKVQSCKERNTTITNESGTNTYLEKYDCYDIKEEIKIERTRLIDFDKLPIGNTTLAIITDIYPDEKVEWVPTVLGIEIFEFSFWTESLSVGLVTYYNLDEISGTNAEDNVRGKHNGSTVDEPFWDPGILGNGLRYVPQDYFTIADDDDFTFTEFTISLWVNITGGSGAMPILNKDSGAGTDRYVLNYRPDISNLLEIYATNTSGNTNTWSDSAVTNDGTAWIHVIMRWNTTSMNMFVDGVEQADSDPFTKATPFDNAVNLSFGNSQDLTQGLVGMTDEIAVYNRSLGQTEITQLYNGGAAITYTDAFGITINVTFPLNDTYTDQVTTLNYTVIGIASACWYSTDGGTTNSSTQTCGLNWTGLASDLGSNNWSVYVNDTNGIIYQDSVSFTSYFAVNITFNQNNQSLELGSSLDIIANTTYKTVCVDVDHPSYGINYSCGTLGTNFTFNISYFRKVELNDSSTSQDMSWIDGGNFTFYLASHQYDEIINLTLNVTGVVSNGTNPTSVKIYINDSLSNDLGLIFSGDEELNTLNDSNTGLNFSYSDVFQTNGSYFKIPKSASISFANMSLKGTNFTRLYPAGVYDEIDDSYINTTLWKTTTTGTGTVIETHKLEAHAPSGAFATIESKDLPALSEINNLTLNVSLSQVLGTGCVHYSQFWVFGRKVKEIVDTTTGESFDLWDIVKNETNGINKFDVFNDGVFDSQISALNNIIKIHVTVNTGSCSGGAAAGSFGHVYYNADDFINNPYLEVGSIDGTYEWNLTGIFEHTNSSGNFNTSINTYLIGCTADSDGYCDVPFYLTSDGKGTIEVSNINVIYSYNPNPIDLNNNLIIAFLGNSTDETDIPIKFESSLNGTLTIDDIRYDYAGGNSTITLVAYEDVNVSNNVNIELLHFYSDWDYNFPNNINYLEFIPSTATSKNVTPYGQTSTRPILNITTYNYGGKNMNFSVYSNETHSCVNLTMSVTNVISDGTILNSSWLDLATNMPYKNNTQLWMWADYSCNYTSWSWYSPEFYFKTCAEDVDVCSEVLNGS